MFAIASILGIQVCNCELICVYQRKRSLNQKEKKVKLLDFRKKSRYTCNLQISSFYILLSMLFHIPKQSNWVECVFIDFLLRFFIRRGEFENFVLGQRNNYIFINVCVQVCLCVCLRVRVKTFNTWQRKVLKL